MKIDSRELLNHESGLKSTSDNGVNNLNHPTTDLVPDFSLGYVFVNLNRIWKSHTLNYVII